jgi:hypothetical protein
VYGEFKNKSNTSCNKGYWHHLKIYDKVSENIPEKHDMKNYRNNPSWALDIYFGRY